MKTFTNKVANACAIICLIFCIITTKTFGQTTANVNQFAIAHNPPDAFNFMGNTVSHYGLGWYYELPNTPPMAYFSGYSGIRFFAQGQPRMFMDVGGNLGLGTSSPHSRLHIAGGDERIMLGDYNNSNDTKGIYFPGFRDIMPSYFGASIESTPDWICCGGFPAATGYPGIRNMGLNFNVHGNVDIADSKLTAMAINSNGNVGIGTLTPRERLSVNGNIRAKEIKVEATNWPDYVFEEDYKVGTLKELESYIKTNKHLPEIPSAKEIERNGVDLGEMNKLLLKKMEELTLHLIEQQKQLNEQGKVIKALQEKSSAKK
ncbi:MULTISPECIES: hypothetical protein [unclassified Pedobacter]|uniref:hypothetical protein n=1 Tax=unclassified Pedobacter TaxID=2628915 RepID=UPI0018474ED6|nr:MULTISPECIES: hypothetical protein [unclassified Pedobacter]NII83264.1 hypothetical protein [Pedobacter sp. SG908]NMN37134.1 hypothetical protein [Pedobacter sp. SG918]